jgi:hypothetical protein
MTDCNDNNEFTDRSGQSMEKGNLFIYISNPHYDYDYKRLVFLYAEPTGSDRFTVTYLPLNDTALGTLKAETNTDVNTINTFSKTKWVLHNVSRLQVIKVNESILTGHEGETYKAMGILIPQI